LRSPCAKSRGYEDQGARIGPDHLSIADLVETVRAESIETPTDAARELRVSRDTLTTYTNAFDLDSHLLSAREITLGDDLAPAGRKRG